MIIHWDLYPTYIIFATLTAAVLYSLTFVLQMILAAFIVAAKK